MRPENYENVKLVPILDAAYALWCKLENLKKQATKRCAQINKERYLFKTIMCPLGDKCPKLKKHRWPNSSIKTVTKFGANCPYAHQMNELRFPEEYDSKIAVAKN